MDNCNNVAACMHPITIQITINNNNNKTDYHISNYHKSNKKLSGSLNYTVDTHLSNILKKRDRHILNVPVPF